MGLLAIHWVGLVGSAVAGLVFAVSFTRVLPQVRLELADDEVGVLAEARVHAVTPTRHVAWSRAWLSARVEDVSCWLQAGFIAAGITAAIVMLLGMVTSVILLTH